METMEEYVNKHCHELKRYKECLKDYTYGGWNTQIHPMALNILAQQIRKVQITYLLNKDRTLKDKSEVK